MRGLCRVPFLFRQSNKRIYFPLLCLVKQEKMDEDESAVSIKTEKTEPSNRRVIPSEVQVADMFANDGNLIFFQVIFFHARESFMYSLIIDWT